MPRINYIASLKLSVKAFGWRKGLKFPIIVYGPVITYHLGSIDLKCPIKKGILTIGVNQCDVPYSHTIINNTGIIEIHGKTYINFGAKLQNSGKIIFHGNNVISQGVMIDISERLELGFSSVIGFGSDVMDNNHHFLININNNQIHRRSGCIKIGAFNWIGSYAYIKKGTVTPDYTVVASPNTLLAKDYSYIEPYTVLAGSPAKPLKTLKVRRVFDYDTEREIQDFFDQHPEAPYYEVPQGTNLDEYCKLKM